ncbi:hypothetical protein HDU79_003016 [Rhizoclosmatium sp. JEL0117]|nr:hypothetical protein HDU79_003016 [Rhizoclosmatium sp. JEL0117]
MEIFRVFVRQTMKEEAAGGPILAMMETMSIELGVSSYQDAIDVSVQEYSSNETEPLAYLGLLGLDVGNVPWTGMQDQLEPSPPVSPNALPEPLHDIRNCTLDYFVTALDVSAEELCITGIAESPYTQAISITTPLELISNVIETPLEDLEQNDWTLEDPDLHCTMQDYCLVMEFMTADLRATRARKAVLRYGHKASVRNIQAHLYIFYFTMCE